MFRWLFLISVCLFFFACQKNTFELANEKEPADAPEYTVELDINHPVGE